MEDSEEIYNDPKRYAAYHNYDYDFELYEKLADTQYKTVLEIGSGTGRLLKHLARVGYKCTGIDLSERMVEYAIQDSIKDGLDIHYSVCDLLSLPLAQRFGSIILTSNLMYHLHSADQVNQSLKRLKSIMHQDSNLLIAVANMHDGFLYRDMPTEKELIHEAGDGRTISVIHNSYDLDTQLVDVSFIYETDHSRIDSSIIFKVYSHEQMMTFFCNNGFVVEKVFGDFYGTDYYDYPDQVPVRIYVLKRGDE